MSSPGQVFAYLQRHGAPGTALGAKISGSGAVESQAAGAVVRLSDGREMIDFGSYGVSLLGHRHPAVLAAVSDQLARMPASTHTLANPVTAGLMADLAERVGEPLQRVWLGSDGADAVEVALKLARRRTGRQRILAVRHAFHGKTLGALALTFNPAFRVGLESTLGDQVTHIDPADEHAVAREAADGQVAALMIEPIQGEGGVRPLPAATLQRWADDAHSAGAFVISDEIQVGLHRCGPLSLALAADVRVDAVLLGKALGGGVMPLSALVANNELFEPLLTDPTWHSTTFGGHPLSCAAGRAAIRALEQLAPRAARVGVQLAQGLARLQSAHAPIVRDVRGVGLLWGVELVGPAVAGSVLIELAQRDVLVSPCLSAPSTIRLLPPMVTTDTQVDTVLAALDEALGAAAEFADVDAGTALETATVIPQFS